MDPNPPNDPAHVGESTSVAAAASAQPAKDEGEPPQKPKFIPQPPKRRKKGLGRKRKQSGYNYGEARASLGLGAKANSQQITAALTNPTTNEVNPANKAILKTPPEKVRKERDMLRLQKEKDDKRHKLDQKKIKALKATNIELAEQLKAAKEDSRLLHIEAMADAEKAMEEAHRLMMEAAEKEKKAQNAIEKERQRSNDEAREERQWSARKMSAMSQKHNKQLEKLQSEHDAVVRANQARYEKSKQRWKKKLEAEMEKLHKDRVKWQNKIDKIQEQLDDANDRAYLAIAKGRRNLQKQIDAADKKEMEMQNYIKEIDEMNMEMAAEWKQAMKAKKQAEASSEEGKVLADKRLEKWHAERYLRRVAEDELARQAEINRESQKIIDKYKSIVESSQDTKRRMKKEWSDEQAAGRRGGGCRWPVRVVQLICELLVNGTPPSAIPSNIETMYETLYNEKPEERPSVNFVRECRVVVEVIGETITAIRLANAEKWDQLWTDATTRRQIPFTALIIGMLDGEDNKIDPVVVSSCIFLEDERSETQAEGIVAKINSLKNRLTKLHEVLEEVAPGSSDLAPSAEGIDINKLGSGGLVTTDTCNTAQKLRRILVDLVDGSYDFDCMHHLRNIWFGNMEKALTKSLNAILRDSLDEIDPKLRVTASISAIIRAVDKEFSLSCNYPKGHGELFLEWMREHYPGVLLLHVERASGSRQDLCTEGSMAIYMNYPYYVEFLDSHLRKPRTKSQRPSMLQENLFVALTSSEMIALTRLLSILHITVCMPFRWLAGKTHELKHHNWGPMSMGRALDTLNEKMEEIVKKPELILDEDFMMGIFAEYRNELPEFQEYWDTMFKKKQMSVIARKSSTKVVHYGRLRSQLFSPTRKTDRKTSDRVIELAKIASGAIVKELQDESKAMWKYLTLSGTEYSHTYCPEERKQALLGKTATNDEAESCLGGTTAQIQRYGRIALSSAGAVSDMKRNAFFHRPSNSKNDTKGVGMFHQFDPVLREAIVLVAMRDAPATQQQNNNDLALQAKARKAKEDLLKEKNMEKATEEYIEAVYYHRMYQSNACWKTKQSVNRELKKLSSDTAKLNALKENITMQVKGLGWGWCHHAWSKKGHKYTINELAKHLKWIIEQEKKPANRKIPDEPEPNVPKRQITSVLGTQTDDVDELDKKYLANEEEFKKNANKLRREREARGEGSMYSVLQPFSRPELEELQHKRIDVLTSFDIKVNDKWEKQLRWCQGEVIKVYNNKKKPTVKVEWDPMPDVEGGNKKTKSDQELLPSKWKKDIAGAWRMDVDISVEETMDDENKIEVELSESEFDIESDEESSDDELSIDSDNN